MIVYTQGSFDLLHVGHINLLRRCRELSNDDTVFVALLNDEAYELYRGYKPAIPFEQRKILLESCKYVDYVIESNNLNTKEEVEKCDADIIVVGSDWASKDLAKQYGVSKEWLFEKLVYVPYTEDVSSTSIKNKLKI
jgi:glycerol-3-phosphate cytidylyltransferase